LSLLKPAMAGRLAVADLVFASVKVSTSLGLDVGEGWAPGAAPGERLPSDTEFLGEGRLLRHGLLLHCTSVGASTAGAGRVRWLVSSSNGRPVSVWMASFRPTRSGAKMVVPDPQNDFRLLVKHPIYQATFPAMRRERSHGTVRGTKPGPELASLSCRGSLVRRPFGMLS
jgi:hypothetical protein